MGTAFTFDIREPYVADAALEQAVQWLHWVDETFSTYQPDSEINRLDRCEITVDHCHREVRQILDLCEKLRHRTDGYFDPQATGRLDPSGVVKGWAIDRAASLLRSAGARNMMVNGGGDVLTMGEPQPGQPWGVGIVNPTDRMRLIEVADVRDQGVATSGAYERGEHIVDPHTGQRPMTLASVTIVADTLTVADAIATAAYAMGPSATEWLARQRDLESMVVASHGDVWYSPGFPRRAG